MIEEHKYYMGENYESHRSTEVNTRLLRKIVFMESDFW